LHSTTPVLPPARCSRPNESSNTTGFMEWCLSQGSSLALQARLNI
jgi:hypothetical protein